MDIQHTDNGKEGKFYINYLGTTEAEMTYLYTNPKTILINHTQVNPVLQGKGIGSKLVQAAIQYTRENQLQVIPLCPFAANYFKEHPEDADVLV